MTSNTRNPRPGGEQGASRPHPSKWMHFFSNSPRLERFVLLLSYVHFFATLTGTLLCVEFVLSGSALTQDTGFLSRALLPIGLLGVFNIPFHFLIRSSGIRRFHFLEHEARLDATHFQPAESGAHETNPDTSGEMRSLVLAIDAADVWDRPAARSTVKAWVVTNRSRLDPDAWAYLRERVGYLLPQD